MKKLNSVFIILTLLLTGLQLSAQETVKQITLKDIYKKGVFRENSVYGIRSMNDGKHFTTLERGKKITRYSFKSGEAIEILFTATEDNFNIRAYEFSADESKILLAVNAEYIYRRSFTADYYIYDIQSKELSKLSENGRQMFAAFSPDASKVGFVRDNNIYIKNLTTDEEKQITFDGKFNHIINGGTDWVYEEEFAFTRAFFWSPNSDKIAYYKFD